ncbi:hypothetical protein MLD38_011398 [Melastoma candidum]|uniref:Uncharacterized protein n=1 Tax=Melastoma candidum TaxID=119954 RepID=A0ACB9R421_9MYRT|nr:hypothetical protein MLD38_011398 [Melastoma candidum]
MREDSSDAADDFGAILAAALESDSEEDIAVLDSKRVRMCKEEENAKTDESQSSASLGFSESNSDISKDKACSHHGEFMKGLCVVCGEMHPMPSSGVAFRYIHPDLMLANSEIDQRRARDTEKLLSQKKLYLILDLDHTLLNSTPLSLMTHEEYLKAREDSLQDVSKGSLFVLPHMHIATKLRPFVRTFLEEASAMFEMYIYTMGARPYALEMANLLDPDKKYFDARVISRDDGTQRHQKGLDVILGEESAVLVLDDTENAWTKHKDNLILMERYHYFSSSCRQFGFTCKSHSQLEHDESKPDGALATAISVLNQLHSTFFAVFEAEPSVADVRQVLKSLQKGILKGCRLVFSRVFPTKFPVESHPVWRMAEQLGATCSERMEQTVTHVVAMDAGTGKSRWAVKEKKFLVNPGWVEACYYGWKRQPEDRYCIEQIMKNTWVSEEPHSIS